MNGSHHGNDEPEGKRAKITLKVKSLAEETATGLDQTRTHQTMDVKIESTSGRGLSRGIREALSLVIKECVRCSALGVLS